LLYAAVVPYPAAAAFPFPATVAQLRNRTLAELQLLDNAYAFGLGVTLLESLTNLRDFVTLHG
jgi:hypothetical protein